LQAKVNSLANPVSAAESAAICRKSGLQSPAWNPANRKKRPARML